MHDQPPGLVDDDDVVVLEHDIERDGFALGLRRGRLRHVDYDRIAGTDVISGVADRGGLQLHCARQDQGLQPRSRQVGEARRQHAVEPRRALVARDRDVDPFAAVGRSCLQRRPL
ncbi:hypothetical protein ES707_03186 [subsurface metagenome]